MIVTRFAPSPTGRLHVGNLRTALHNWLLARAGIEGGDGPGKFLLRIDDTDAQRSREEYVDAIRQDLAWLGLEPDGEYRQSQRLEKYDAAFEKLKETGRVYPAYETAQELELKRKIALGRGRPPIYDRAALELSEDDRAAKQADGISPHWRFKLDREQHIDWSDGVRGPQKFDPAQLSDPVIRRADGSWLYMLPSVVDDLDMGVTDVLRGEDHVSNTAVQVQMFSALHEVGVGPDHCDVVDSFPRFGHTALLVGKEGKLSKRLGSLSCEALREQGIEPAAILSLLARLGTSQPVEPIADRQTLIEGFDLATFGRSPAKFDDAELERLNAAIVHQMEFDEVRDRLPDAMDEAGWHAIRPNLSQVGEAAQWWKLVTGPIEQPQFSEDDRAFLGEAADALEWSDNPWGDLTAALKERTGRKGKPLFLPLRQALTGMDHGPDMSELLPLIGEDRARSRLQAAAGASAE